MNPPILPDPSVEIEVTCADVVDLAPQIGAGMVVLVDCREPHEWAFNHIPNSLHLPLGEIMGAKSMPTSLRGVPVIIYCHHGMRSLKAARALRAIGHTAAYSMSGGIDVWSLEIDSSVPRY